MTDGSGFAADPHSLDGSAHLLIEMAGLLHEGRLDAGLGTLARTRPRTPNWRRRPSSSPGTRPTGTRTWSRS